MKNFIKIVFIIFSFFISLCAPALTEDYVVSNVTDSSVVVSGQESYTALETQSHKVINSEFNQTNSEKLIASNNTSSYEITRPNSRKNNFGFVNLHKLLAINRLSYALGNFKYFKFNYNLFNNNISYLKNEIYTRAP